MGQVAREFVFTNLFSQVERDYDAVLIDVAPSINLLQTCAMTYARSLLIPVSMDPLSLQGGGHIETARTLSSLIRMSIWPVAILPVMVDRRLQITEVVSASLRELSVRTNIPLLPPIRTDTTVTKCSRAKQFLADFDPPSEGSGRLPRRTQYTAATARRRKCQQQSFPRVAAISSSPSPMTNCWAMPECRGLFRFWSRRSERRRATSRAEAGPGPC